MNIAEIWDKQKALNSELDNMNPHDPKRAQEILDELDKLEKEEDKALKKEAEKAVKRLKKQHEAFCKRNYKEGSEPYYLLKWFVESGRPYIFTDDVQYGDWEKDVPEKWLKAATKDKNKALKKYFDVMGQIEELFNKVCYLQSSYDGHFPDHRLTVQFENTLITMRLIEGQGSDFQIWKADEARLQEEEDVPKIILSYEELLKISKLGLYDQTLWYKDFLKDWYEKEKKSNPKKVPKEFNETLVMWILGTSCAGKGFIRALNETNFKEQVESWT